MCNEALNLVELLGNCPKGTQLYSPILGEVTLERVDNNDSMFPIYVEASDNGSYCFTREGRYYEITSECLLFPSKEQRDWSKFNVYKEGDFLTRKDGRAFIFKGYTIEGYPIAYGGVDTCDNFIPGNWTDNNVWTTSSCRKATSEEIECMMQRMKEAGYIWDPKNKTLIKDLPVDTLVIVSDEASYGDLYLSRFAIRRYAGKGYCFNNSGGSKWGEGEILTWDYIIPLDKFTVTKEGIVEFKKEDNYGTYNC